MNWGCQKTTIKVLLVVSSCKSEDILILRTLWDMSPKCPMVMPIGENTMLIFLLEDFSYNYNYPLAIYLEYPKKIEY